MYIVWFVTMQRTSPQQHLYTVVVEILLLDNAQKFTAIYIVTNNL